MAIFEVIYAYTAYHIIRIVCLCWRIFDIFNLKTLETMPNYAYQFIKIRLVFHMHSLWNEAGDANFYFISETSK